MIAALAIAAATPPASYRALGTEPFWNVAIAGRRARIGEPGRRDMVVAVGHPERRPRGWHWRSRALTITTERAACSDGMSDRVYPDRVTIVWRGRRLEGCGGHPPPRR